MRLLTLISSRNEVAKKISNVATQIILWEWETFDLKKSPSPLDEYGEFYFTSYYE